MRASRRPKFHSVYPKKLRLALAAKMLATSALLAAISGCGLASRPEPTPGLCGADDPRNRVAQTFELGHASEMGQRIPSLASARDLQRSEPIKVVVFADPFYPPEPASGIPRPSPWLLRHVVCVIVQTDSHPYTVFTDVDFKGCNESATLHDPGLAVA